MRDVLCARLSEERKGQGDDDCCDGALACGDDLAHVDRNLDVRRSGSDNGSIGAARWVKVAAQELAWVRARQW